MHLQEQAYMFKHIVILNYYLQLLLYLILTGHVELIYLGSSISYMDILLYLNLLK